MSLINQVLIDLEKRGVNALPGETSIRVVHARKNISGAVWLIAAILVLAAVAAGLWWISSEPGKTTAHTNANPVPVLSGNKLPVLDVPLAGVSAVPIPAMPVVAVQAESQPAMVATQKIPQEENRQKDGGKTVVAATHPGFGLSAIPLPSGLRDKPVAAATGRSSNKAASPIHAGAPLPAPRPPERRASGGAPVTGERNDPSAVASKVPAIAPASAVAPAGSVDKQIKQISVREQADNEFRKASGLMQQGRINEAVTGYEAALQLDANHDNSRQALVGLLLENKRHADAERVLQEGLKHNPRHSGFAMLLARLQVERNELALALDTLHKTLPHAGQQADYQAFIAALLQRQGRHNEAISRYQIVLQLSPDSGVWLMGLGISLQAVRRNEEARDAFKRAIESHTLSAELQAFVEQRLKEL